MENRLRDLILLFTLMAAACTRDPSPPTPPAPQNPGAPAMPHQRTRLPGSPEDQAAHIRMRYQQGERDFHSLYLTGVKLDGATLTGANFSDCDLDISLVGADLREASFTDTHFDHADLSKARLEGADFHGATFFQSTLDEALLQGADFTRARFSEVYLRRADLTDAQFVHADLSGDVSLEGANLTGAVFDEANLIHLRFPEGTWPRMRFRGALYAESSRDPEPGPWLPVGYTPEAEGMRRVGPGAKLAGLDLRGFRFRGDLSGADFTGSDLSGAYFRGVVLKGTRFQEANLDGAAFEDLPTGALEATDFAGAHGALAHGRSIEELEDGITSNQGMSILFPSPELADIVGPKGLSRNDAVKKAIDYAKTHNLVQGKVITADEKLRRLTGKEQLDLFELSRAVNKNLLKTRRGSAQ